MASAAGGANGGCWQPSKRSAGVQSFKVMDVLARAGELEREGRSIVHMEVGQPQTGGPRGVVEAAKKALDEDRLGYTAALGTTSLRERIATHYQEKYGVAVAPSRVVVTTGSSGAFLLSFISLFDAGDRVALASAGYPCYRNILNALGCEVVTVPINEEYKVTAKELGRTLDTLPNAAEKPLKGIILSSPSNPTGAMLTPSELEEMAKLCESRGVAFISDEIYHGICFGKEDETALRFSSRAWVINSFSKYYSMTGWRLGWMIVPESFVDPVNRLAQNMYINAPTLSQIAAVAAFDCKEELEGHMLKYKENRSILLDGLASMGFTNVAPADGAFYIYVDVSKQVEDSVKMAWDLLETAGVAITPGNDFEDPASDLGRKRIRFSYCGSTQDMREGMERMKKWWEIYAGRIASA